MIRRRGFMLVACILISIIIAILGMAFLSSSQSQILALTASIQGERAHQIALAGLESVRVKLNKDSSFPPVGTSDQKIIAYTEEVLDLDLTTVVGSYQVILDGNWLNTHRVLRAQVIGSALSNGQIRATHYLQAEFDMHLPESPVNPRACRMIVLQSPGS